MMNIPVLQNHINTPGHFRLLLQKGNAFFLLLLLMSFASLLVLAQQTITVPGRIQSEISQPVASASVVEVYGTQRKEAVTGFVDSIGRKTLLEEEPLPNVTQALQGRMAGVDISQTSARRGATMQIRIRGTRLPTGSNDPLVLPGGIPFIGSLAAIDLNDSRTQERGKFLSCVFSMDSHASSAGTYLQRKTC